MRKFLDRLGMLGLLVVLSFGTAGLITACGTVVPGSQSTAQSFNGYAADTLIAADRVVALTRTLLASGKITADDAENVWKTATALREGVATARKLYASSPANADAATSKVRAAADALDSLSQYLARRQAAVPIPAPSTKGATT